MTGERPVALVTGDVPEYRREPFRVLAEREGVEVLAFGRRRARRRLPRHAHRASAASPARGRPTTARSCAGLGGRVALPGRLRGRPARAHPVRALGLALGAPAHARARALVAPHAAPLPRGRRRRHLRAARDALRRAVRRAGTSSRRRRRSIRPAVRRAGPRRGGRGGTRARAGPSRTSRSCCSSAGSCARRACESLADGVAARRARRRGVLARGRRGAAAPRRARASAPSRARELPALYAAADVLVLPSIRTATFTEPWGFVANEAMHQGTPVDRHRRRRRGRRRARPRRPQRHGRASGDADALGAATPPARAESRAARAAGRRRARGRRAVHARGVGRGGQPRPGCRRARVACYVEDSRRRDLWRAVNCDPPPVLLGGQFVRNDMRSLTLTRLTALLSALLIALAVPAIASASGDDVIRDCAQDGDLDRSTPTRSSRTPSENLPSDIDQYSDCRDVIRQAQAGGRGASGTAIGGGGGTAPGGPAAAPAAARYRGSATGDDDSGGAGGTPSDIKPSSTSARTRARRRHRRRRPSAELAGGADAGRRRLRAADRRRCVAIILLGARRHRGRRCTCCATTFRPA